MNTFNKLYHSDLSRYGSHIDRWVKRYLYYFRKVSTCNNNLIKLYYRFRYRLICERHGIEIPRQVSIGEGFYLGHPYNITINEKVVLGKNINIHKGVTIGQENRGQRKGVPSIGDCVWIGVNSTIVGKITIGNDVLIAPNTYVNRDIPSHSIVMGNPCKIFVSQNATADYINNKV